MKKLKSTKTFNNFKELKCVKFQDVEITRFQRFNIKKKTNTKNTHMTIQELQHFKNKKKKTTNMRHFKP